MKKTLPLLIVLFVCITLAGSTLGPDDPQNSTKDFYQASLHYTNKGLSYIYSKEQGGLERLTGKSAEEMGCLKASCHATTCDVCHGKDVNGLKSYTLDTATLYSACKKCHGDLAENNPDVHFAKGLKCMDCHTSREIHGDGKEYNTYLQPGFFDANCKKCHGTVTASESHTIHGEKVDCNACHMTEGTTCLNCHLETRMAGGKGPQIPLKNMAFLVNHNGKVTLANMISYVYGNKTMITFAKNFSHTIRKEGRTCKECHQTETVNRMKDGSFRLVKWENDSMVNATGVIPVPEGYDWNLVFCNKVNGKWIPMSNPDKPVINYSGYCSPLTSSQFESLLKIH